METIEVIDGRFEIPEKFKDAKRLHIKQAWSSELIHKANGVTIFVDRIQIWFRSKQHGDKPYIPEGFVEINGERFKFIEIVKVD